MIPTGTYRALLALLFAALFGFLAYTALINHFAYRSLLSQVPSMKALVQNAPMLSYGVVESINVNEKTITVRVPAKYTMDTVSRLFRYAISDTTVILRQELQGSNGVYDAISSPVPASFADVHVGDNVAVLDQNKEGQFVATLILFGNPL